MADDFSQNYCIVTRFDDKKGLLRASGRSVSRAGILQASLVKVGDGRLRIVQGHGEVQVEAPLSELVVNPTKLAPASVSIDAGGHHSLVDFGRVRKNEQARATGIGSKLAVASELGNLKVIQHGKQLRKNFVDAAVAGGARRAEDL